jgi:hypothetical protein
MWGFLANQYGASKTRVSELTPRNGFPHDSLLEINVIARTRLPATLHAAPDTLAEVDGVAITSEEVDKTLAPQLSKLEEQIYNLKRHRVEALINDKLPAKEAGKGVSVPALLDAEVTSKVGLVTEQEVEKVYQENRDKLKGEESNLRDQIRGRLQTLTLAAKREEFLRSLRSQAKVVVNLKPPPVLRVDISVDGAPFRGPPKALLRLSNSQIFIARFAGVSFPLWHNSNPNTEIK